MRSAALPFSTRSFLVAWSLGKSWTCVREVEVGCDQRPCRAIDRARPMPWTARYRSPLAVLTVRLLLPAPHESPWFLLMRRPRREGGRPAQRKRQQHSPKQQTPGAIALSPCEFHPASLALSRAAHHHRIVFLPLLGLKTAHK